MKVILYMAVTVNGQVATLDDRTPWSKEEWKAYSTKVKELGNEIIGRKTYELVSNEDFESMNNPIVVVISSKPSDERYKGAIFCKTFNEGLKVLEDKGFSECMVGGGGKAEHGCTGIGKN